MTLPWPTFWEAIREEDRPALKAILAELLTTGVLLGEDGRARELYLVAREYPKELAEFLSVLDLELIHDPDKPIFQARPVAGECALTATFSKDETLVVLALWRFYDEERTARPSQTVVLDANLLDERLRLYFESIEPPQPTQLDRILSKLRRKKLIRYQRSDDQFGASQLEILPTLPRVIPFEDEQAWAEQAAMFSQAKPDDAEGEDTAETGATPPNSEAQPAEPQP